MIFMLLIFVVTKLFKIYLFSPLLNNYSVRNLGNAFLAKQFESARTKWSDNTNFADTNLINLIAVLQCCYAPRRRAIFAIYPFIVYEQMKFNRRACREAAYRLSIGMRFAAITKRL